MPIGILVAALVFQLFTVELLPYWLSAVEIFPNWATALVAVAKCAMDVAVAVAEHPAGNARRPAALVPWICWLSVALLIQPPNLGLPGVPAATPLSNRPLCTLTAVTRL